MPRKKRFWQPDMCHHIMFRGVDGRAIFNDDQDRIRFLLLLQEASEYHIFKVHAFCLMTNHLHLLLEPVNSESLTKGVHRLASRYAQYFNARYKKRGYVFQGRFRSILIENGLYLRRLVRYIHLNPLEAGIAKNPEDYFWSSHRAYFAHTVIAWLECRHVLSYFGRTKNDALAELATFIMGKTDVRQIAEEIHKAFRLGAYGTDEFIRQFAPEVLKEPPEMKSLVNIEQVIDKVCNYLNISIQQLRSSDKSKTAVDARAVLARISQKIPGLSLSDVSKILNKHHGTVSRLASRVSKEPKLCTIVEELVTSLK